MAAHIGTAENKLYAWSQNAAELIVESSKKGLKRSEVPTRVCQPDWHCNRGQVTCPLPMHAKILHQLGDFLTHPGESCPCGGGETQVHVAMKPNHLRFSLDGLSIIDGTLREPIHPSESTWQIEECKGGESRVILTLTKAASNVQWPSVVV